VKLRDVGEFGLLDALGLFGSRVPLGWVGPGDDAAVLPSPAGPLLLTTDLLIEGVHFRRATTPAADLGYKAVAVNASDVAAMGGRPLAFTISLGAPAELEIPWVEELYKGLAQGANDFGCALAGGDTSSAPQVCISIALLGTAPPAGPVLRSGARAGHDIFVSGNPGESALGLHLLEARESLDAPDRQWLVSRHRRPEPRLALGAALGEEGLASSLIDISDGLLQDLGHVLRASGVGAEVWVERLPISTPLSTQAHDLGLDPVALAMGGGEDYELLFTAPAANRSRIFSAGGRSGTRVRRVGRVTEAPALRVLDRGKPVPPPDLLGFDHFSARG